MSGGGKNQTSKQKVIIPKEVLEQYRKATDMASAAADRPWQSYSSDPNAFVAGMTPTQMAGMENINANAQAAQPWYQGAGEATVAGMSAADLGGLDVDQYMSPYLRNVAQTTSDLLGQQNEQAMSGQLGNAIAAGAGWGDRSGIAAANLNRQQMLSSANILSNLLNQGYTQAQGVAQQQQGADLAARQANLARLMQGGLNLGQLGSAAQEAALQGGQAQMAAGQQEQQTEQARLSAMYNQWLQQQAYPFQTAQFFSNIAQGIGANSGSTTSLTQPAGFFSGLARGGRAGKADGGGLSEASMGGHVGTEHAMQGYAGGGMPQDYSATVLQALFGGGDPNAGAYGMAGGLPGGATGFVPKPNMQGGVLKTPEMPEPASQTSIKDVISAAEQGADIYNSKGAEKAGSFVKGLLGYDNPMQQASGGRIGYGLGGTPYESSATSSMGGLPAPGGGYVPPPMDSQSDDKLKPTEIAPKEQESGLGKIVDIAKIAAMFFLKDGGVAGPRHGYDAGGAPASESWEDWLQKKAAALGLAEDRPVAEIRREAYGNATPPVAPAAEAPAPVAGLGPAFERAGRGAPGLTAAGATPGATSGDMTDFLNDVQEQSQAQAKDIWAHAWRPDTPRAMSALDMGAAALAQGAGVYLPGAVNYLFGDPTRANPILGPSEPAAPATTPPPPADLGTPAAPAAPPVEPAAPQPGYGVSGMGYTPALPTPGLAPTPGAAPAAAGIAPGPAFERAGRGVPVLAATGVERTLASPVTQEIGVSPKAPPFLVYSESGNDFGARNEYGYVGRYQFGEDRLADAKRAGVIPLDMTSEEFRNNKGAQRAVEEWHFNDIDGFINSNGLDKMIGQTINGTPVTRDGMVAVAHLGGKTGLLKFIQSGGSYNPADANGTHLSDYLARGAGGEPADQSRPRTALAGADISAPATSGVPLIRQAAGEAGGGLGRGIGGIGDFFQKNENILLPILSGIGAMASSPSRYLGSAILQGIGAGAGSYMKRQGQLADIAQTQALTRGVDIANVKGRFFQIGGKGPIMVLPETGGTPVTLGEFMKSPATYFPSDPAVQAAAVDYGSTLSSGQPAAASADPASYRPTANVRWDEGTSKRLADEDALMGSYNAGDIADESVQNLQAVNDLGNSVLGNRQYITEQAQAVSDIIKAPTWQGFGPGSDARVALLRAFNYASESAGLGTFSDIPTQQDILNKISTAQALGRTSQASQASYEALARVAAMMPSLGQSKEGAATIMATLMMDSQMNLDRQGFYNEYAKGSTSHNVRYAGSEFQRLYDQVYKQELPFLKELLLDPAKNEYLKGATSGRSAQEVQRILQNAFGDRQIPPQLYRYFTQGTT